MFLPFLTLLFVLVALPLLPSASPKRHPEVFYQRNVFYAGGKYKLDPIGNRTILVNQIYVEQLTPLHGKTHKYPIVFVGFPGVRPFIARSSAVSMQLLRWYSGSKGSVTYPISESQMLNPSLQVVPWWRNFWDREWLMDLRSLI